MNDKYPAYPEMLIETSSSDARSFVTDSTLIRVSTRVPNSRCEAFLERLEAFAENTIRAELDGLA